MYEWEIILLIKLKILVLNLWLVVVFFINYILILLLGV